MQPDRPPEQFKLPGLPAVALQRDRIPRYAAIFGLFALVNVLLISWLDPAFPWPMTFSRPEVWSLLALNFLPVLLLNALFFIVTRRVVLASWLSLLLLVALYAVNSAKVRELATPLLPDDFLFLKALRVNYTFFSQYFHATAMQIAWAIGISLVTLVLWRERVTASLFGLRRVLAGLLVLTLAFTLIQGRAPWKTLYDPGRLQFEPWAPFDSAMRIGLIPNLLLLHWELDARQAPDLEGAAQTLRASLDRLAPAATPGTAAAGTAAVAREMPDIILLQSESLFEPAALQGVVQPQLTNYVAIAAQAQSGMLRVPTFAGGTIRTEFEVLTGMPLSAFPQVRYPYLQLDLERAPSVVKALAAQGYRTLALHPNGGAFWNRNYAFRALGFDRFEDGGSFAGAQHHGWYVSDAALTDRVIASLADDGPPQLVLAISIQNHGPYTPHEATQKPARCAPELPALDALDVYCDLARASDEQLRRLVEFARARERPTLVLFYSDHMPPLQPIYDQLGFRGGVPATQQLVPWLLFDNRDQRAQTRELQAWQLPLLLLERAQIAVDGYYDVMRRAFEEGASEELANAAARLGYWGQLGALLGEVR